MSKKIKAQVQSETPETEWPMSGGTYVRHPDTGALAKQETTVIPTKVGTQSNTNPAKLDTSEEDLNHGT